MAHDIVGRPAVVPGGVGVGLHPGQELGASAFIDERFHVTDKAPLECAAVALAFALEDALTYAVTDRRRKLRFASENPAKLPVLRRILARHPTQPTLVIGTYVEHLEQIAARLEAPIITGRTPHRERERLYDDFRAGRLRVLVVSKVANFAIDLPDAEVAIQVSGTFGSRQEEAQRLGRLLRPKTGGNQAQFYSLVTRETVEQDFAMNRQRFLTEQGYAYRIVDAQTL